MTPAHPWRRACNRGLVSGSAANATSALALAACSKIEQDSAAAALNGPSQWVWGEAEAYTREATVKHTLTGYLIHHAMSILWGTVHERLFGENAAEKSAAKCCMEAAATATLAYVTDYHIAPRRLRPGFRKHLGPRSIFAVYAAFAVGLAAASIARTESHTTPYAHPAIDRGSRRIRVPLPTSH